MLIWNDFNFLVLLCIVTSFQSCVRCCKSDGGGDDTTSATTQNPLEECSDFPATSRTCKLVLEHNCTSRFHYDNYMATISGNEKAFRNISDMLLDGGCDCRDRSIELFCQLNLPRCSSSASEQSTSCAAFGTHTYFPCWQYCLEIVEKCLFGVPQTLVSTVFGLLNRTAGGDDLKELCDGLPNASCWNNSFLPDGCTGQIVQTTVLPTTNQNDDTERGGPATNPNDRALGTTAIVITAACIGAGVLIVVLIVVLCCLHRRRMAKRQPLQPDNVGNVTNGNEQNSGEVLYNVLYKSNDTPQNGTDVYEDVNAKPSGEATIRFEEEGDLYTQVKKDE